MNLEQIISNVPDYKRFMTVDEMDESTKRLAEKYPDTVEVLKVGNSRNGHPILCMKIGKGSKNALCFALPHPNEPIGAMTMEYLSEVLASSTDICEDLGFTWYIIKCIDPDGTRLNEGWFKGPFDLFTYSRNFYRPVGNQQVEWTFPFDYKEMKFKNPIPETQALMRLIDEYKPDFIYSLHNAGFGGAYWYITHDMPALYNSLRKSATKQGIPLNRGEPEAPFLKEFSPAIFQMMSSSAEYEYTLKHTGEPPKHNIGTCSGDYALSRNKDCVTLLTELPYFYDNRVADESVGEISRKEAVAENVRLTNAHYREISQLLEPIRTFISEDNVFIQLVAEIIKHEEKNGIAKLNWASSNPDFEKKASISQIFDNLYTAQFYNNLFLGMTVRAIEFEIDRLKLASNTMSSENIQLLKNARNQSLEMLVRACNQLESDLNFEVIPIQTLVRIQIESGLKVVQHLAKTEKV
ncbi:M14 family zinc carboxypeptidase [Oceanobacillus neutriphilus]|uniref:Zinc carboxypeptidase n=1 Tax=Oceanobacillus neutriphilus TaxID=531815 RepID=A0ABQ2NNL1_9BACI|nr:M14 family zinc carboxypeptidase [Oceanobacillus neutriphilus]GGP06836.1 zinc carboxypeptidase [Oceanobacillus neutriphilus]